MGKITIKDIAKALQVSVSTVSKALADSYEISEETKKKVLAFAEAHHYIPNRIAKNLKQGKTNTIGVIVCDIANTFISQVVDGIQTSFMNKGVDTLIMQSHHDEGIERQCLESLINKGVDGILISPVHETSNLDYLIKLQKSYPIVLFDRIQNPLQTHKVGADNVGGGFKATQHLLRIGKKDIVIILADKLGVSKQRLEGCMKALKQYKVDIPEDNIFYVNLKDTHVLDKEILNFIQSKLSSSNPPNAVICGSETISTRSLGIFAQAGIKVPEEIAVVGFANTSFAFSLNPPLTTIVQPAYEIGEKATVKMIELLKNSSPKEFEKIELETKLVIRKSSGY
ncbi:LacI family DNA-binding transcriptional regulator [Elizabethkingia sp. JS20170427COW]|uniref:LacI family DNA-binding transcriptional regulator n=1 Tax=Elizabethkingia sp. JS20170427COW TaxID=2583851 RepID=UPI001110A0A7|nr:LacI family DNA-binding transcriptional regulator [Elizabethkingia sp. JS20170427COW]QCX52949.1 LacI family transcriptional regulator [Elizabethkingia sp. JS20170427COW]